MKTNPQGKVGVGRGGLQDGADSDLRLGKTGDLIVSNLGDFNSEACMRGMMFTGGTGIAGIAPGTVLSTTPPIVLYNPPNSGVILSLTKAAISFLSGTMGAGNIVLAACAAAFQNLASLGTDLAPVSTLIGSNIKPAGKLLQAPTLSAAPTQIRPLFYTGAFVTNATGWMQDAEKVFDGEFCILPGGALAMQGIAAAGTSPLVLFGVTWKELPVQFSK